MKWKVVAETGKDRVNQVLENRQEQEKNCSQRLGKDDVLSHFQLLLSN